MNQLTSRKTNFIILDFLSVYAFFAAFIGGSAIWNLLTIPVFLLAYCTNNARKLRIKTDVAVIFYITGTLFLLSVFVSSNEDALLSNIRSCLYSICVLMTCYEIDKKDRTLICDYLNNRIKLFNILLIINIIIVFIQAQGTGFLIKNEWLALNGYYEDHCAGVFGMNSTNHLGVFSILVMLINMYYCKNDYTGIKKRIFYLFTIICQVAMAVASQFNDNVGFYALLVIFGGLYGLTVINKHRSLFNKLRKILKYVVILCFALLLLFSIPGIMEYATRVLVYRYTVLFNYNSMGGAAGSSERFAVIEYAFQNASSWLFGVGIGSQEWFGDAFGFRSFGINSAGAYVLLGGIWFFIAYMIMYAMIFFKLICVRRKNNVVLFCIVLGVVLLLAIYTSIFNDARMVYLVSLIAICYKVLLSNNYRQITP